MYVVCIFLRTPNCSSYFVRCLSILVNISAHSQYALCMISLSKGICYAYFEICFSTFNVFY